MTARVRTVLVFLLLPVTLAAQGGEYRPELQYLGWIPYVIGALGLAALSLVVIAGCALGVYRSVVGIRNTVTELKNRNEPAIRIELVDNYERTDRPISTAKPDPRT